QANARKAANLSRQEVLKAERAASLGNPVRGITTPFVQSFDTALDQPPPVTDQTISKKTTANSPNEVPPGPDATSESYLNFFVSPELLSKSLRESDSLTAPIKHNVSDALSEQMETTEPLNEDVAAQQETARAAIRRIVSLANSSSKDRTHVNIKRCIEKFGRHKTDQFLPPKPAPNDGTASLNPQATRRAGPDTGSSEVQIAILTAKIRTLANYLETRGGQDKMNKRNLRLLVHRRQKLLQYMRKKERGGPRWQHLIETLGLTEGTWKGEISL
ncbi:hypothetical protein K490DRAFT_45209, partial [Saccharata proteae CBS 121410]